MSFCNRFICLNPSGGSRISQGTPSYYSANSSWKLHGNEENLTGGVSNICVFRSATEPWRHAVTILSQPLINYGVHFTLLFSMIVLVDVRRKVTELANQNLIQRSDLLSWNNFLDNMQMVLLLPPANKVCEGRVFTGVCLSTEGGVCCMPGYTIPLGRHPPSPPAQCMLYGQQAGSTHPTGMHSCFEWVPKHLSFTD